MVAGSTRAAGLSPVKTVYFEGLLTQFGEVPDSQGYHSRSTAVYKLSGFSV